MDNGSVNNGASEKGLETWAGAAGASAAVFAAASELVPEAIQVPAQICGLLCLVAAAYLAVVVASRTGRRRAVIGAVVLAAAWGLGVSYTRTHAEGPASKADSSDALGLSWPASWAASDTDLDIPGLTLTDTVTVAPQGRSSVTLTAGLASAEGRTLLSRGLSRLISSLPQPEAIHLANGLYVFVYPRLRLSVDPGARLSLLVGATNEGVATAACYFKPGASVGDMETCERIARTLNLEDARAYQLGPRAEYASSLSGVLDRLRRAHADGHQALVKAETVKTQSDEADRLSEAFTLAAVKIEKPYREKPSSSPYDAVANRQIARALRRVGTAYGRMAERLDDPLGSDRLLERLTEEVRVSYRRLRDRIAGLEKIGYRLS